ncbi:GNAT family N-acetyltransferase [Vibrio sp. MEBiC08052]|uniref:GNAT family N-acetyltransferase n=1 Tax=Vibrio sp. MEBiC08052 TaxID=1761910 RepID=UPI0007408640|nr:GNAT family N-acetyltransferase [Vibrio sp. MEBiC08052]KUI97296.1 GCN5-related N-acetyltransferase [Vibrio sp. MEBiC08052]
MIAVEKYRFSDFKALGIRALLVDHHCQSQGVGTKAINLFSAYVAKNYPDFEVLQLTVNCRNKAAYHCYCKCGFEDTGKLYLSVPQHIM